MDELTFVLNKEDGKLITKRIPINSEKPNIEEIIEMFYSLICIDLGIGSGYMDEVLKYFVYEEKDEELILKMLPLKTNTNEFKDSQEFVDRINSDIGFREFMFDRFKEDFGEN